MKNKISKSINLNIDQAFIKYHSHQQIFQSTNFFSPKQCLQTDIQSQLCLTPKNIKSLTISDFTKLRYLGAGIYGRVYLVKHKKSNFLLAIKVVPRSKFRQGDQQQRKKMTHQFISEIKIQMYCNHPNIIKLYGYFSDLSNFYLLMQLGCDGQLFNLMQKQGNFSQESASILMRQITNGTVYLHQNDVIHRDIKPENIVIVYGTAKICDFGWSVYCPKQVRSTLCGSPLYFSPQLLKGKKYDKKIDSWALGNLAYELVTGENPFRIRKQADLIKIVTQDAQINQGSKDFKNFISKILNKDSQKRPTAKDILNLRFIQKYRFLQTSQEICLKLKKKKFFLKK